MDTVITYSFKKITDRKITLHLFDYTGIKFTGTTFNKKKLMQ